MTIKRLAQALQQVRRRITQVESEWANAPSYARRVVLAVRYRGLCRIESKLESELDERLTEAARNYDRAEEYAREAVRRSVELN